MTERIIGPELLERFRAALVRDERSGATVEKYLRDAVDYGRFLGGGPAGGERTREYKEALLSRGYAPSSVNSKLVSLNALFKFAGWEDCRTRPVRVQRCSYCPEERELTEAEFGRLLAAARSPGQRLLLRTIAATGIRISELQYITVAAAKRGEARVTCKGKTRRIFIPRRQARALTEYAKRQGILSGPVFLGKNGEAVDRRSVWAMMKRLARRAGVAGTKVFPHNLRKLFARLFHEEHNDLVKLADVLGHSSIETTRIYLRTSGESHRAVVEKVGERLTRLAAREGPSTY